MHVHYAQLQLQLAVHAFSVNSDELGTSNDSF